MIVYVQCTCKYNEDKLTTYGCWFQVTAIDSLTNSVVKSVPYGPPGFGKLACRRRPKRGPLIQRLSLSFLPSNWKIPLIYNLFEMVYSSIKMFPMREEDALIIDYRITVNA